MPTKLDKRALIAEVVRQLNDELETLAGASRAMHADASDEQNKAEDKYDTRGLETAYLASSQARQATATENALAAYHSLELPRFTAASPIAIGAVIELESRGERLTYFLGPSGGGIEARIGRRDVLVITPESPLGRELIGKKAGDRIKLTTRGPAQMFQIVSVQ